MSPGLKLKSVPHLSMQTDNKVILDEIDALLLRRVLETNSLTLAARLLGISYRNAWGRVKRIETSLGKQILVTKVGGATGGGSRLTSEGLSLFRQFRSTRKYLFNALDDRESAGNVGYKLSARNRIRSKVTEVKRGEITSQIRMTASTPVAFTSIISNDAVDELNIKEGDAVVAIIKSTEVMIGKPFPTGAGPKKANGDK